MSADPSRRSPGLAERVAATCVELCWTVGAGAIGILVVQVLVVVGVLPAAGEDSPAQLLGGPLLMGSAAFAYAVAQRRGPSHLRTGLSISPPPLVAVAWRIPLLVVALLVGSALLSWLLDTLGLPIEEQAQVRAITDGGWRLEADLLTLAFSALVLAPLAEEWLFRGLLFRRIHLAAGPALAYSASALLFAISHINPSGLPIYLWQGLVFAAAYRSTGRLWAAMLVHFVNNALTLALLLAGLA